MQVSIKTPEEIEKMRVAGRLAAEVLEMIGDYVKPGVSTEELDRICHDYIVNEQKCIPAPLNYKGFPKSICTSVNHVICHGIPSEKKILKDGDILNIDVTVIKDGYHGDTSKMWIVGKPKPGTERLIQITQECLYKGIELVKPGTAWEILATSFSNTPRNTATLWFAIIAAMASARYFTKSRRLCITANPAPAWSFRRA